MSCETLRITVIKEKPAAGEETIVTVNTVSILTIVIIISIIIIIFFIFHTVDHTVDHDTEGVNEASLWTIHIWHQYFLNKIYLWHKIHLLNCLPVCVKRK